MRTVIGQLEGILQELKEVAKELREVVSQIDRLTSDFDFELEPDDWTPATASSTSSSDKGTGGELGPLDLLASDLLSDSWELCSLLEGSAPWGAEPRAAPARLLNGGVPLANGPRGPAPGPCGAEAPGAARGPAARAPGARPERVRFSDTVLYHALCCDDDEGGEDEEPRRAPAAPRRPRTRSSGTQTVADKSTQTALPYVPARHKVGSKN
ncbi:inhibitory synaptic factor 1 [Eudromia elegans]